MKTYEELSGGEGRRVFFRAERYKARELFQRAQPVLTFDQMPLSLYDVSLSGMSAITSPTSNQPYEPEKRISIQLKLGDYSLFESAGEVARLEPTQSGTKLGVRLLENSFNVSQVVSKYKEVTLRGDLAGIISPEATTAVSAEYRLFCADVIHLLRSYRNGLERMSQTNMSSTSAAELLTSCEERIMPAWKELWHRGNALVSDLLDQPEVMAATKRYTELVLTPEFMPGAIWKRSYEKPLGYPGDFQIMDMVYNWQRLGDSLYDKLVHRLGLEVAECIATRMVLMRQEIAKTALAKPDGVAKVATLGCGPAREIIDYLKLRALPRPVQFTLIDQDHGALELAYEATYPEVIRLHKQASVRCLHASFNQIFKTKDLFAAIGQQDFVYSVGLIDYLQAKRARTWVQSLYKFVAPGGKLIISNMYKCAGSNLWPMEFLTDWNVIYRDEAEMRAMAEGMGPEVEVTTELDPTGRVIMLALHKRA